MQMLITHPDKCFSILLVISRIPTLKKYVPKFNALLERYNTCPTGNKISTAVYSTDVCYPDDLTKLLGGGDKKEVKFEEKLKEYEENHETKVIFINHKYENGMYGISFFSSYQALVMEDSKQFIDIMRTLDDDTHITLILNTTGGSLSAAEIIIHSLATHKGKLTTYIPYKAMSAGTLIALASDEIYMDKNAYCGQCDPQIFGGFSACNIIKYCDEFSSSPMIGGFAKLVKSQAETSMNRIKNVVKWINDQKNSGYDIELIEEHLLEGKFDHDMPLFTKDLENILPNIKTGIPDDIMDLYKLFNEKK